ncbi:DUF6524 family protein [Roseospira navarrensis]|uniref:Uncharacterized protein n=1 Tax=Roseospira navarrensis TaxID=140058 RepID=A0A7X1ZCY2_9PROT|nr:DUF6524 family protein [Roseospira navarrensis]MQX36042.1 hypothetical protein [Roseospira navarrensis]
MAASGFSFVGFAIRWVAAIVLVMATYNPTGWSFAGWIETSGFNEDLPLKALAAIVLLIGYILYVMATLRSIGKFGIILLVALFAILLWVIVTYTGANLQGEPLIWIGLVVVATIMAVGMSWSHIWRRITGQLDVDDVET